MATAMNAAMNFNPVMATSSPRTAAGVVPAAITSVARRGDESSHSILSTVFPDFFYQSRGLVASGTR
jgi:hypothetical protein